MVTNEIDKGVVLLETVRWAVGEQRLTLERIFTRAGILSTWVLAALGAHFVVALNQPAGDLGLAGWGILLVSGVPWWISMWLCASTMRGRWVRNYVRQVEIVCQQWHRGERSVSGAVRSLVGRLTGLPGEDKSLLARIVEDNDYRTRRFNWALRWAVAAVPFSLLSLLVYFLIEI